MSSTTSHAGSNKYRRRASRYQTKRLLGQFSKNKVQLLKRSTGLICKQLHGGRAFLSACRLGVSPSVYMARPIGIAKS